MKRAPAALTAIQAAQRYGRPVSFMYRAFVWGLPTIAPLGKPNEWSVWHASLSELEATFGKPAQDRARAAARTNWQDRTVARIARRQAKAQGHQQ